MKAKLFFGIFVLVLLAAAALGVTRSVSKEEGLSDLELSNIEALDETEVNPDCPTGCKAGGDGCFCRIWYPCMQFA